MSIKTFSIIIPTYNNLADLFICLGSLTKLNYAKHDFEVIVINDGNERADRTVFCFKESLNIYLIESKGKGPAAARNIGARAAKKECLAFIDDDCTVDELWLKHFNNHLQWFPNSIVGGHTINGLKENIYSEASQLLIDYIYSYYNKFNNKAQFVTSNNFGLTRVRFVQVGGFNENFSDPGGEDRHFCKKWLNYGYKIIYQPKAIVNHWHELTLEKFWKQQFNYGKGAHIFKEKLTQKNEFEPISFYINLILYPIRKAPDRKIRLTMLFIFSQVAILAGLLYQKFIGNRPKSHASQPST